VRREQLEVLGRPDAVLLAGQSVDVLVEIGSHALRRYERA
jgi:hypothetical protein